MIRNFLIAIAFFTNLTYTSAQKTKTASAPVKYGAAFFEKSVHAFGNIPEAKGTVKTTFTFKNIGQGPLRILNVTASCGCTVPSWTKNPVKAGDKGSIEVTYDPKGRPGNFHKTLTVETDGNPLVVFLTIGGSVEGEETYEQKAYPVIQGGVRMSADILNFDNLTTERSDSTTIVLYNNSAKTMIITGVKTPPFIRGTVEQQMLLPGKMSTIKYVYYPMMANDYGPRMDETYIMTSDDTMSRKIVVIKANIKEGFSGLTPKQRQEAPRIDVPKTVIDMGELYLGEIGTYKLEFINKGKSDLMIRKAGGSCGCTVADIPQLPVKKGKKGFITVKFNTKGLRGNQEKQMTIYSNDPDKPVVTVTVKAKVIIPGVDPLSK